MLNVESSKFVFCGSAVLNFQRPTSNVEPGRKKEARVSPGLLCIQTLVSVAVAPAATTTAAATAAEVAPATATAATGRPVVARARDIDGQGAAGRFLAI